MKKRIFSLLLSALLCVSLTGTAFAEWNEWFDDDGNSMGFHEGTQPEKPDPPEPPEPQPPEPQPPEPQPPEPTPPPSPGPGSSSSNGRGDSDRAPTYRIEVPSRLTGGTIKVSPTGARKGSTVTITVTPDSGYQLDKLTVTDSKGNAIEVKEKGDNKYTFTMPGSAVKVNASFVPVESAPKISFTDVRAGAYYYDAVAWAVEQGITAGTTATTFSPNNPCTRAQIVTFLWRAAGSPSMGSNNPFTDVAPGVYYYDAVQWAVAQGITAGTSATTFSPNAACTRGQAVTFLYRAAGSPAASGGNAFTDVAGDAYYSSAVQWAVNKGVTAGTSATAFSPNDSCTRAQIVTFLYRDRAN